MMYDNYFYNDSLFIIYLIFVSYFNMSVAYIKYLNKKWVVHKPSSTNNGMAGVYFIVRTVFVII